MVLFCFVIEEGSGMGIISAILPLSLAPVTIYVYSFTLVYFYIIYFLYINCRAYTLYTKKFLFFLNQSV